MAFVRRARVARAYPGLDVGRLTAAEVHVYESLIPVVLAEDRLAGGGSLSPDEVRESVEAITGNRLAAQVAEAKARLAQAARQKGF